MIGNFGNAEVFSFHATKFLNTFEGGAVMTNDDELATRMRFMRNLGFRSLDDVVCVGTNGKMNEVSAAMGLTGLESIEDFIASNHSHYLHYRRELSDIPGITLLPFSEGNGPTTSTSSWKWTKRGLVSTEMTCCKSSMPRT